MRSGRLRGSGGSLRRRSRRMTRAPRRRRPRRRHARARANASPPWPSPMRRWSTAARHARRRASVEAGIGARARAARPCRRLRREKQQRSAAAKTRRTPRLGHPRRRARTRASAAPPRRERRQRRRTCGRGAPARTATSNQRWRTPRNTRNGSEARRPGSTLPPEEARARGRQHRRQRRRRKREARHARTPMERGTAAGESRRPAAKDLRCRRRSRDGRRVPVQRRAPHATARGEA